MTLCAFPLPPPSKDPSVAFGQAGHEGRGWEISEHTLEISSQCLSRGKPAACISTSRNKQKPPTYKSKPNPTQTTEIPRPKLNKKEERKLSGAPIVGEKNELQTSIRCKAVRERVSPAGGLLSAGARRVAGSFAVKVGHTQRFLFHQLQKARGLWSQHQTTPKASPR